jgi:hypothetical protein
VSEDLGVSWIFQDKMVVLTNIKFLGKEKKRMKTFVTLIAILLAMVFVVPAFAGEEPYKAVVWDDYDLGQDEPFYISAKEAQFLHSGTAYPCETFQHSSLIAKPEVCCTQYTKDQNECPCVDPSSTDPEDCAFTENYMVGFNNPGWYKWAIQLPKKPEGELNIEIECGIVKPNQFEIWKLDPAFEAIDICAAETGEVTSGCIRTKNYLKPEALPTLAVMAYHGCQGDGFDPFYLTAYRTPAAYGVSHTNTGYMQVLNGDVDTDPVAVGIQGDPKTRIALKPCMEKSIMIKYPVAGWMNAAGQQETDLQAGDIILVTLQIPKANTVDIYCNKYSVKIGGIGEPEVIPQDSCTWPYYPYCPQCSNWYCTSGQ